MTRTIQKRASSRLAGARESVEDPVIHLSVAELEALGERIARDLVGVSRDEAFRMLERGDLRGTLAEPELTMVHSMLGLERPSRQSRAKRPK